MGCPGLSTSAKMGRVPSSGYKARTQFRHWKSSSGTGRPVPKLGYFFAPSSGTGRPILARWRFGDRHVPVSTLDTQCRNWAGAKMGANIYTHISYLPTTTEVVQLLHHLCRPLVCCYLLSRWCNCCTTLQDYPLCLAVEMSLVICPLKAISQGRHSTRKRN